MRAVYSGYYGFRIIIDCVTSVECENSNLAKRYPIQVPSKHKRNGDLLHDLKLGQRQQHNEGKGQVPERYLYLPIYSLQEPVS